MGFKDRIRIYSVLMEGLRMMRDIPQKQCRAVAYSHGGHLLAVASGFSVVVYTTITAQLVSGEAILMVLLSNRATLGEVLLAQIFSLRPNHR